jgi:hypothetical protein
LNLIRPLYITVPGKAEKTMKIGCLQVIVIAAAREYFAERIQFNPQVGDVENNIRRADAILAEGDLKDLDLLILPEMAFSGMYKHSTSRS